MKNNNEIIKKTRKAVLLFSLTIITIFIIISVIDKRKEFLKHDKFNEKASIEYLKQFTQGKIIKIVILTDGHYSKFNAICTFVITDTFLIKDFIAILSKQEATIKKKTLGQHNRITQITIYNKENNKYSFQLKGEPYSGNRPINQMDIVFFENPEFDVSENWLKSPSNAINNNIHAYGPINPNLQNYELYYFLKKNIIDFTEENRPDTAGISGKCFITKEFKK